MSTCIVMGSQLGDEGKGKVVDLLARDAEVVVRFQGGANAGHTIQHGARKVVLHQLPSGVLTPGCLNLMGNGSVVDPELLLEELAVLAELGVRPDPATLGLSSLAHVVSPIHKRVDAIAGGRIGTTGRGIGFAYSDKARRIGIRLGDILDGSLAEAYERQLASHRPWLDAHDPGACEELLKRIALFTRHLDQLRPYVRDIRPELHSALLADRNVLYEGAQGALLDLDHGTYPFVTSSSTAIGGALTGTGVFTEFHQRIAVVKAYTTRVGNGPFPTELTGTIGEELRARGHEYGATTGRPRRCGWLDLHLLRQATRASGYTGIALTKIDCLSGLPELMVATGRDDAGDPVYTTLPGWSEDIMGAPSLDALPSNARSYIDFITEQLGVPISILSTGPDRDQTLVLEAPW
jgi:adenylosuccinate synthase